MPRSDMKRSLGGISTENQDLFVKVPAAQVEEPGEASGMQVEEGPRLPGERPAAERAVGPPAPSRAPSSGPGFRVRLCRPLLCPRENRLAGIRWFALFLFYH